MTHFEQMLIILNFIFIFFIVVLFARLQIKFDLKSKKVKKYFEKVYSSADRLRELDLRISIVDKKINTNLHKYEEFLKEVNRINDLLNNNKLFIMHELSFIKEGVLNFMNNITLDLNNEENHEEKKSKEGPINND